jgi:hypothetical protein
MRKQILLIIILFLTLHSYGQTPELHYIKFLHVGEKVEPVYTLNISFQNGNIPKDKDEAVLDTLHIRSIVTDEKSYYTILSYIKKTNFKYFRTTPRLDFGTLKIIDDGKYFYLPSYNTAIYLKNLVVYLKRKKSDIQVINAITENYPLVFNGIQ